MVDVLIFVKHKKRSHSMGLFANTPFNWNRIVCVSWEADVLHCGLFQKETSTTWVVDQSTGTKAQLFYQASRAPERVELTIKQQEVLLLESTEAFTRATVTGFQFSENVLLLAVSSDPKDSAGLTYACSTWRKKPWWAWT